MRKHPCEGTHPAETHDVKLVQEFSPRTKYYVCRYITILSFYNYTKKKKVFAERSKILLDTDQKIILLDYQINFIGTLKIINNVANNFDILAINFIGTLKIISNAANNFDILAINFSVLHILLL